MISDQLRTAIGDAVDAGQTYYEIAKNAGVDWRVVSEYHSGQRTAIRIATADALCEYLGLELCRKKAGTGQKQPAKKAATKRKQPAKSAGKRRKKAAE